MSMLWKVMIGAALAAGLGVVLVATSSVTAQDSGEILAKVGDKTIRRDAVAAKAASSLAALRQQEYEIIRSALDEMIEESLLDAAAAKEGKTREELVAERVDKKLSEPTDAEIETFYNDNKQRVGGRTLDQVKPQIAQYLTGQRRTELYGQVIRELKEATPVTVLLDPPRIDVAVDDDPFVGPQKAPVTIISFSDYECPYCSRAEDTVKQVLSKYEGSVRVVFRDYPLDFHKNAVKAAEAAGCAHEQGKFSAMHDKLFQNQRALGVDSLAGYAEEIGLNLADFKQCLDSGKRNEEVRADIDDGAAVGVTGTPAFFINGRLLTGAQPLEAFVAVIDEELARAKN